MIKYWKKIVSSQETSMVKKVYNTLKNDDMNNKTYKNKNWVSQIKLILNEHGFGNIWLTEEIDNSCLELIRKRIFDNYFQKWYSEIIIHLN